MKNSHLLFILSLLFLGLTACATDKESTTSQTPAATPSATEPTEPEPEVIVTNRQIVKGDDVYESVEIDFYTITTPKGQTIDCIRVNGGNDSGLSCNWGPTSDSTKE